MAAPAPLTIAKLVARPVNVPMKRPLVTGGGTVGTAPLLLLDLHTKEGVVGRAYLFCYTPLALRPIAALVTNFNEIVAGEALAPFSIEQKLQKRLRLVSMPGLIGAAMAGIDMAAWDALARAHEMPLVRLLGGTPRAVRAYNSCGLGLMGAERTAREAIELAENFPAVKLRLGYPDLATDISVTRAVRKAVGDTILVMTDYNQCLSVPEAITRAHALDNEGVAWIEEPTVADDYAGNAAITRDAKTPIQIGENWWGPHEMAKSLAANASDFVMPDAGRIGGVSGWLRAAALAQPGGVPMSSHLYPEISAHLLAVTPTCHWLEYVDWAEPVLRTPSRIDKNGVVITDAPGIGLEWDEAAIAKYAA